MNSCKYCDKTYKHQSNLSRHIKTCDNAPIIIAPENPIIAPVIAEPNLLLIEMLNLIKEQKETNQLLREQNALQLQANNLLQENNRLLSIQQPIQQIIQQPIQQPIQQQSVFIINKNNTNEFLNNTYRDALNIEDFLKDIEINDNDIQYTIDNTSPKGIAKIFTNNIKNIPANKRPIWYSNKKIYIKSNDVFQETNDIIGLIRTIEIRQLKYGTRNNTKINMNDERAKEKSIKIFKALTNDISKNYTQITNLIIESIKM